MYTFLKTLLIILLVYFGLKFILKWAKPYLMRYAARKMAERFEKSFGGAPFSNTEATRPEGDVTIDKQPQKNTYTSKKKVGEYIDFEEIE